MAVLVGPAGQPSKTAAFSGPGAVPVSFIAGLFC